VAKDLLTIDDDAQLEEHFAVKVRLACSLTFSQCFVEDFLIAVKVFDAAHFEQVDVKSQRFLLVEGGRLTLAISLTILGEP